MAWAAATLRLLLCATSFAATSTVSTVSQLESALASAKANGEDDVINVAPGTYYLISTLTYHAPSNENRTLTVQCPDGGAVIDAGTNLAWMTGATDMDGQARVFNRRVDMGADETSVAAVNFAVPGTATSVWDAVVDATCRLQYSTNLASGGWNDIGNIATATSRRITLVDTNPADAIRLYSLKWLRP